jgi:NAD+ dependent glucose-6-phosphate dehydrogenase
MKVLITGAAGALARRLRPHFSALGWSLVLLDRAGTDNPAILQADLAQWAPWTEAFADVDAVVHLAGDPRPGATWASVQANNIDATLNVFGAAAKAGVKRIVFASSNWVLAGHRFESAPLEAASEPYPVNAYGAAKLFGERLGRAWADIHGISTIALRIGYCQRDHDNRPGAHMGWGLWGQRMWLSDRDLCQGFEKAITAPASLRFGVFNLVSANDGMRWRLDDARDALGYVPADHSSPVETPSMAEETEAALRARRMVEASEALVLRRRW